MSEGGTSPQEVFAEKGERTAQALGGRGRGAKTESALPGKGRIPPPGGLPENFARIKKIELDWKGTTEPRQD